MSEIRRYVVVVETEESFIDMLDGDESIETVCEQINSCLPHDINVRPLSEWIAS